MTLLGIVFGIAAVISFMFIGRGVQQTITERIRSLGTNLLFVRPGAASQGGVSRGQDSAVTLTLEDACALLDPLLSPSVVAVAPELRTSGQVVAGSKNTSTQIVGVTPEYQFVRNYPVGSGQFIVPGHLENISSVAVLGPGVAESLFGLRNPVGQVVRVNGRQFSVIGVLESKGGGGFGSSDDQGSVPITTVFYRLASQRTAQGGINVQTIDVGVRSADAMGSAVGEVATMLRLRHRITREDDFTITNLQETVQALREATEAFVLFLGAVAGISLLVGGIGVMNIMLVPVTERTREIGIRKAMGPLGWIFCSSSCLRRRCSAWVVGE